MPAAELHRGADLAPDMKRLQAQNGHLRAENHRLRAQNEQLRTQNRRLQAVLDAHLARAQAAGLFGPMEMTAGTAVGPGRRPR